jgi:diacylglycerol kinase (ATP)
MGACLAEARRIRKGLLTDVFGQGLAGGADLEDGLSGGRERPLGGDVLKVGVIVNPAAGGGRLRRVWPEAEAALRRRFGPLDVAFTEEQGEGRTLAARFAADGVDLLIAAGGDGTVSEVVDGLLGAGGRAAERVDLGIVPVGTGADLSRALGVDGDFDAVATGIDEHPARPIDVGLMEYRLRDGSVGRRHFVNIASLGISADIAMAVNASRKRMLPGRLLFAWHAVKEIIRYQAPELVVRIGGEEVFRGKAPLVAVANNHSFAGGMMIAPDAQPDDGLFDVVSCAMPGGSG